MQICKRVRWRNALVKSDGLGSNFGPKYTDHPQVNIHCIEKFFNVQDFSAICACPEKQSLPWKFSNWGLPPPPLPRLIRLWWAPSSMSRHIW